MLSEMPKVQRLLFIKSPETGRTVGTALIISELTNIITGSISAHIKEKLSEHYAPEMQRDRPDAP